MTFIQDLPVGATYAKDNQEWRVIAQASDGTVVQLAEDFEAPLEVVPFGETVGCGTKTLEKH